MLEELGRCTGGRDAERVNADHLTPVRVVDQRLRLAAPAEDVPHGGDGAEHGAGRVDGVAALEEHHCAGRRTQRLAGDRHPVPSVQHRFHGPLRLQARRGDNDGQEYEKADGRREGHLGRTHIPS